MLPYAPAPAANRLTLNSETMKATVKTLITTLLTCLLLIPSSLSADVVDLEELALAPNSFYNGGPNTNNDGWFASAGTAGNVHFGNNYDSAFGGFWNGFSYSNVVDTTTPGFQNQYAAFAGSGASGSEIYAVGFSGSDAFVNLATSQRVQSVDLTNTTYAALSMLNGDAFAKKFGGVTGDDPDFFSITFTGYSAASATGTVTGSVEFFLADYRFVDNSLDYIVDTWQTLSLADLNDARSIGISFQSSDVGPFGINTPTYVALDNLTVSSVPEPTSGGVLMVALGLACCHRRRTRRLV